MNQGKTSATHILFVANNLAGAETRPWDTILHSFFKDKQSYEYTLFVAEQEEDFTSLKSRIIEVNPQVVVAIGGDGTVNAVAKALYGLPITLGIIPAGSANGLAKNLGIPTDPQRALEIITDGHAIPISSLLVNERFCIHLSDIGLNARLIRRFEHEGIRGVRGYIRAGINVLRNYESSKIKIYANNTVHEMEAVMVVVANATTYGTGFVINPVGRLDDSLFEIIVVKKYSIAELYKMAFNNWLPHPDRTVIIQCTHAIIESEIPMHFQVDGEYISKVRKIEASINNKMLQTLAPLEK